MLSKPAIFPGPASQARLAGRLGLSAFIVLVVVGIVTRGGRIQYKQRSGRALPWPPPSRCSLSGHGWAWG